MPPMCAQKRSRDEWTVPTRLDREIAANPFLRADDKILQRAMGHENDTVATFAANPLGQG